ncbi:hypothetical protein [Desulforhopalus singaporensis]|uniref:Uncharacterized protein n=1 Tax=Desulforhopalus singaporensis TaxID=91360 RepID=A0A1H0R8L6_9BACT|nr:hypothetical protein [Desulforhopalus singaporensis]SDP25509.1 hypothetical protein SAMN05660330_02208 [Desulforhopalus singaporensis]
MAVAEQAKQLVEDIGLLIDYGVDSGGEQAKKLVAEYCRSILVLKLLKNHYSILPEAREDAVIKVSKLQYKDGIYLFVVATDHHAYLYLCSQDRVVFIGEYLSEMETEVLTFFEYSSQKEFRESCPPVEKLAEYPKTGGEETNTCPVCGVEGGEYHLLGCVVEVCPWCEGQLASCNCRFELLDVDEIEDEDQLEAFADLLHDKGRIVFSKEQSPAYPGTSKGVDRAGNKIKKERP